MAGNAADPLKQSLVSVVMPVYNAADSVEEAVRSLLLQTYRRLEIIVVDDGSVDRSAAVVTKLADTRVKILRRDHHGLVAALNHGCASAEGYYVARLDADDVACPTRIAAQVEYLDRHPAVGLLGTWVRFEGEGERAWRFAPPVSDRALRRYLLWDNPFVHSSVMFRRDVYRHAGGYVEGPNEDYRLWITMARNCTMAVLPDVLVTHRIRRASHSRSAARDAVLRHRLKAQWDAARLLGPWPLAIPPLAITTAGYLLARLAGRRAQPVREPSLGRAARFRGIRPIRSGDGRQQDSSAKRAP